MLKQLMSSARNSFIFYIPSVTVRTASFNIQQLYALPTLYLYVLCGSENKQQIFPYSEVSSWFI
jgi:hypothetical protein